jgi:hypothetical protein
MMFPGAESGASLSSDISTLVWFALVMFGLAFLMVNRRTRSSKI